MLISTVASSQSSAVRRCTFKIDLIRLQSFFPGLWIDGSIDFWTFGNDEEVEKTCRGTGTKKEHFLSERFSSTFRHLTPAVTAEIIPFWIVFWEVLRSDWERGEGPTTNGMTIDKSLNCPDGFRSIFPLGFQWFSSAAFLVRAFAEETVFSASSLQK